MRKRKADDITEDQHIPLTAEDLQDMLTTLAIRFSGWSYMFRKQAPQLELETRLCTLQDGKLTNDLPQNIFDTMLRYYIDQSKDKSSGVQRVSTGKVVQHFFKDDLRSIKRNKGNEIWQRKSVRLRQDFSVPNRKLGFSMVVSSEVPDQGDLSPSTFTREKNMDIFRKGEVLISFATVYQGSNSDMLSLTPRREIEIELDHKRCSPPSHLKNDIEHDTQIIGTLFTETLRPMGLHHPMSVSVLPSGAR